MEKSFGGGAGSRRIFAHEIIKFAREQSKGKAEIATAAASAPIQ